MKLRQETIDKVENEIKKAKTLHLNLLLERTGLHKYTVDEALKILVELNKIEVTRIESTGASGNVHSHAVIIKYLDKKKR